jgi:hypothetical protein
VLSLVFHGDLQVRSGAVLNGVRLLAAASAAAPMWQHFFDPSSAFQVANALELARTQLGPEAFGAAWAAGQAMTVDQAAAYALGEGLGGSPRGA